MRNATIQQKKQIAKLATRSLSFEEAARLIPALKREVSPLPANTTIEEIRQAQESGDNAALGRALRQAKRRTRHGCWLPLLEQLGIHRRRAQRLMMTHKTKAPITFDEKPE